MEVLQNEFEIDLLRLYSRNREQKNQIDHNQSDLVDHRVDIASNRQNLGGLSDTVSTMQKHFHTTSPIGFSIRFLNASISCAPVAPSMAR